ncbi:hypothetical protein WJX79_000289 [Trebouxia sp. C0005]
MKFNLQGLWICFCGIFGGVWTRTTKDPSWALIELGTKLPDWGAAAHGKMEYLLCYACAGSQFQMCAMRLGISGTHQFRRPLSLITLEDRLQIVLIAVQRYWVMKAQAKQFSAVFLWAE